MSKIELPTVTGNNNISRINDNFKKIEDALNQEVLYRKGYVGEPNEMETNLDMNGKEILNVSVGTSPGSLVTRGYVDQEIAEERTYVDQELAKKFDKSGGPLSGPVNMQNNQINNLPNATQPSQPVTYAQLLQVEAPGDSLLRSELAAAGGAELIGVETKTPTAPALNLKQWLNDEVVNLRTRFGVRSEATARNNTDNLQAAYDELGSAGGGRIRLPASAAPYFFAPSVLSEPFDNYGAIIQAEWACIVARPGVLLEGDGVGRSIFRVQEGDVATMGFLAASPSGGGFRHLSVMGNSSTRGNSHGIINVNISTDPIHLICDNWLLEHLELCDLGSYGIGINNGDITNLRAHNIYIHNVGADGIDTKQRGPRKKNIGMNFSNIIVDGFGQRLTGCAGLDFHGLGQVTNLTVRNMGLTSQTGFRMRTLDPTVEGENARMARASNIVVETTPSNDGHIGAFIGSSDCVIQGAVARGVTDGFQIVGNANGAPDRSVITDAHAIDCAQYGYFVGTGANDTTLNTAYAINCNTGFRNQGARTTYMRAVPVNCPTKFSSASTSAPTERFIGSDTFGLTEYTSGSNIIVQEPKGAADDIEVRLKPKGISRLSLMDGSGNRKVQVDGGGVGFNGAVPAGKMTLNAAATDATTTTTLVNQIRAGLIADGLAQ